MVSLCFEARAVVLLEKKYGRETQLILINCTANPRPSVKLGMQNLYPGGGNIFLFLKRSARRVRKLVVLDLFLGSEKVISNAFPGCSFLTRSQW